MITYRVHGPLCHESINGEDMIAVVEAETAQVMLSALKEAEHYLHSEYCTSRKCMPVCMQVADAIAKAEGR